MDFEKLTRLAGEEVRRALEEIPEPIRHSAREVPIFLEETPGPSDVAGGIDEDTLGLFDEGAAGLPTPRIRLWLVNLWDYADEDPGVFREEVRTTLLHELGHFLGWDEEDLEERGLG